MKGAVAAGHPATATAAAQILEQGGNAVDACIAAGFVSWVAESPLTGPGAGGFMLVHRASDRTARLLDFFVALPGRGLDGAAAAPMDEIEVPFDAQTMQLFRIGGPSCAVPGTVGAVSSITSALLGQLVMVEVVRQLQDAGEVPPIYLSANVPGGDEHNHTLESRYAGRIRRTA